MMKYKINVKEILSRVVDVEAENIYDAEDIVRKQYKDCEIVLDTGDFQEVGFYPT